MQLKRSTLLLDSMIDCQRGEFDKDVIVQSKSIPVIVDFYAGKHNIWILPIKVYCFHATFTLPLFLDWCGPCKLVAPIFKALADELPQVKFVKVDTEVHEDSVDSFNIQGLPLFGIFVDGKMVRTYV